MPQLLLACACGALRTIPLIKERSLIGRKAGCDIRIDEPGLAPIVGFIARSLGDAFAVAEREDAPLMINGEPVARRLLRPGDEIRVGSCLLTFQSEEPASGPLPTDLLAHFIPEEAEEAPEPPAAPAPILEPRESAQELDSAWPQSAWARLSGVAGARKGQTQWLTRDLFLMSCSGSSAVITRRSGLVFLTPADGMAPMINRRRASQGPSPLPAGALIGLGASVLRFEPREEP